MHPTQAPEAARNYCTLVTVGNLDVNVSYTQSKNSSVHHPKTADGSFASAIRPLSRSNMFLASESGIEGSDRQCRGTIPLGGQPQCTVVSVRVGSTRVVGVGFPLSHSLCRAVQSEVMMPGVVRIYLSYGFCCGSPNVCCMLLDGGTCNGRYGTRQAELISEPPSQPCDDVTVRSWETCP